MWVYSQSTGNLWNPYGLLVARGYSGFCDGKNNPSMQGVVNAGPIPRGMYVIGAPYDSKRVGSHALPLVPHLHDACGRTALRIHGDSAKHPGEASRGCIILPLDIREAIAECRDRLLLVIE